MSDYCPTCGSPVIVTSSDEGTHAYLPVWREDREEVERELEEARAALAARIRELEAEVEQWKTATMEQMRLRSEESGYLRHDHPSFSQAERERTDLAAVIGELEKLRDIEATTVIRSNPTLTPVTHSLATGKKQAYDLALALLRRAGERKEGSDVGS